VTPLEVLGVGLLGGAGALARIVVERAVSRRAGRSFPYGTLLVNISGAFLLGLLTGLMLSRTAELLLATGFTGAYTTFSTWSLQSDRLARDGRRGASALNVFVSLLAGLAALWAGRRIGIAL
jgi:CrcB protein